MLSEILIVLITIICPPIGVLMLTGCSTDLIINICLTILGYLPGHIHAFYVEYMYLKRREEGISSSEPAPGIYSQAVLTAGERRGYGTV